MQTKRTVSALVLIFIATIGTQAQSPSGKTIAASPEEVGSLALAAGMDVELPMVHGYGQVLVKAVQSGKVSESQLNESVRRVLRDKFALGLFDKPYVAEDPIKLETLAKEGNELSRRLADESVTLLKNDEGLLPFSRDVKNIAIIGPHADSVGIGFAAYSYPAAVQLPGKMRAIKGEDRAFLSVATIGSSGTGANRP